MDNKDITAENLPLSVREHLMRGQHDSAVEVLETLGKTKAEATELIEAYRATLRERKVALDIQIMNEENEKENAAQKQLMILWGSRILITVLVLALMYLLLQAGLR